VPAFDCFARSFAYRKPVSVIRSFSYFAGPIFEADRALRDARPDDRIVMEQFILQMAAK
jgi:hypothetical protein